MKPTLKIVVATVGAFFISRLFEDSEIAFILIFIALQSIIEVISKERCIEINIKKSPRGIIILIIGCFIGGVGTLVNYILMKNTWIGIVFAGVLAVSLSTIIMHIINVILEYVIKRKIDLRGKVDENK